MVLEQRSYARNNNSTGPLETDVVPLRSSQGTSGFHEMNHPMVAQTFRKSARATSASDAETWVADEYANTLNTFDVSEVRATTVAVEPLVLSFPSNAGNRIHNEISVDISSPLKVGSSVGIPSPPPVAMRSTNTIVRRLTPDECCVLQGFPPDWNDGQADSHRYKQMGNAVTVTVARWIAERMARFL